MSSDASRRPDYELAYEHLCASYHAIDDFRTKLLGFLPLASGAGIFLLFGEKRPLTDHAPAVGLFGFAVTLGLLVFELYGIAKCAALISSGVDLECRLGIGAVGQFTRRPHALAGRLNEAFASGVIYPAVLGAWVYVALVAWSPLAAGVGALATLVAGVYAVWRVERRLRAQERRKRALLAARRARRSRRTAERREATRAAKAPPVESAVAAPEDALKPPGQPTRFST